MMLSSSSLVKARKASTPATFSSSRLAWSVPSARITTVFSRISAMRVERRASRSKSLTLTPCLSRSSAQVMPSCLPPTTNTRSSLPLPARPMKRITSWRLPRVATV
jgi:hypothetical protein